MTTQASLPRDLECIMSEAIEDWRNEDAVDDAVNKIEAYRQLFGCGIQ